MNNFHNHKNRLILTFSVFIFVFVILAIVQVKLDNPIILLERFVKNAGWAEIFIISMYASLVAYNMYDIARTARWRKATWTVFSVVFFLQLTLGLLGNEKFLMTGKLHLPIPMMIIGGTIYRMKISFMPILFVSTVVLAGPAWCSHLCYFGAFDSLAAGRKSGKGLKNIMKLKLLFLALVILAALMLRAFGISIPASTILAGFFGVAGVVIILTFSVVKGQMVHCTVYCPVGTVVNFLKFINPFRMCINNSCNLCLKCTKHCKYSALNPENIKQYKPGDTCTYCGDCLTACSNASIEYRIFGLSANASRNAYLFITISVHAVFLALARI